MVDDGSGDSSWKEMEKIATADMSILDFVVAAGFISSKGEARRLIEQNGLSINNEKVTDGLAKLPSDTSEILLQKGKKNFLKVVLKQFNYLNGYFVCVPPTKFESLWDQLG